MSRRASIVCGAMLVCGGFICHAAEQVDRAFTVKDSIEMTRLVSSAVMGDVATGDAFRLSPDGRRFFLLTRKGDLSKRSTEYSLRLYEVDEVVAFINNPSSPELPQPRPLLQRETAGTEPAIGAVAWTGDSRWLTFIGSSNQNVAQVFRLDVQTGGLQRLSDHPARIVSYALSTQLKKLVYSAYSPIPPDADQLSYVVSGETDLHDYRGAPRGAVIPNLEFFLTDVRSNTTTRLPLEPDVLARPISVSPNGRWAVVATTARRLPESWMQSRFMKPYAERWLSSQRFDTGASADSDQIEGGSRVDLFRNDAFGSVVPWIVQYRAIDLASGTVRTVIDAPVTSDPAVTWISGNRASLSGVLIDARDVEPSTIDVELSDSGVRSLRASRDRKAPMIRSASAGAPINLQIAQAMNSPPELLATDVRTGRSRAFTDLNPQLRDLTLGTMSPFRWTDRHGTAFEGGLIYPPRFDPHRRYPVVIQTYGFDPGKFLVDGPDDLATAYAARAIANEGMLVLQAPLLGLSGWRQAGVAWRYEDDGEMPRFTAMLDGAIDALADQHLIDRSRVGVIGFSREGMRLHHALVFSRNRIAAATIADSAAATPFCYSMTYGYAFSGMLEFEGQALMGAPFWRDGIKTWIERSPLFYLDRIGAALRLEIYSKRSSCYWDTLAILKRHGRPVEMIMINEGNHLLETPQARYISQQGNVDWFAFWLQKKEDPSPDKAAQYVRWRGLRDQRDAVLKCCPRNEPALTSSRE